MRNILVQAVALLRRAFCRACAALPLRRTVVFVSFGGASYSDNPRAVAESLSARCPDLRIVWLFTDPSAKRDVCPFERVRIHSPRAIYHLATARAWVLNTPMPGYLVKRPGQFYVQTWHGDRGFKVCLHESGKRGLPDTAAIDLAVTGSAHAERFFREAFRYAGAPFAVGSPRDDLLLRGDPVRARALRAQLGLPPEAGLLLYAPTMRDSALRADGYLDARAIDFAHLLDALTEQTGKPWRLLVRAHVRVKGIRGIADDPRVLDATRVEDMRDLLLACDLLLTDYSSCAGDFPLTGRPVLLFQNDRDAFEAGDRSFYFDIDQSPFVVARDFPSLLAEALRLNGEAAAANDRAILAFFGAYETGDAAERVARRIIEEANKP